jgi:hypothetical protein
MFSCRPADVRVYRVLLRRAELPEDLRRVDDFPEDDFPDDRLRERDPRDERPCSLLLERARFGRSRFGGSFVAALKLSLPLF